ncbi:glycoside hydrolase family 3 protein [Streptomyces albipurpureus]|uniref:beta-glucosidase n=1 Tax=Streptomyces albipurpureus TaxID=2897419 RepID=A0ABT0UVD7_9ACTN|nr:glycoside hydrolase family 3 N-terminal domain-containing protein [Streptomyces sp. CWNU-1]MCM2391151.1 glycoside hydrolase family 3 C-terminal domain-containing protein [Streptomyces sp. CWNU-1]
MNTPVYRDAAQPVEHRVEDLLARMTVSEKAGLLFQTMITMNADGTLVDDPAQAPTATARRMITDLGMNHFNLLGGGGPRQMALWHNHLQELAAQTRLGIPVTLSSDPRHSFTDNPGTAIMSGAFSQWPETLGLAALNDSELVRRYADTVRREYLAVGIRLALHPQIDLATEPRWSRIVGTFGEDAELTSRLVGAYIEGLRGPGDGLGADSVSAMVKHFPGGGPQKDGEDPHFDYGREQVYPAGHFDYHLRPFRAALAAGATQMMPYYGMPVGTPYDEVGFGFNKGIITGLLREELGFDGIVCTDWGLVSDAEVLGQTMPARAWGVEHLSPLERAAMILDAGGDQFGGEHAPELVVELVESGRIPESRVDTSVRRLLAEKFRLGLFDERRYVDPDAAEEIVGSAELRTLGDAAQRRSLTLLKNGEPASGKASEPARPQGSTPQSAGALLPLSGRPRVYVAGVQPEAAARYADVVTDPAAADLAILRLDTPFEPRTGGFEAFFHAGRLDFAPERLREILSLLESVPTVVAIHLERPAVIPEIAERAGALLASYGASDAALLDVLFGHARPEGRLPFQLPRSMAEVAQGHPDLPQESSSPLYPFGHGLRYSPTASAADPLPGPAESSPQTDRTDP